MDTCATFEKDFVNPWILKILLKRRTRVHVKSMSLSGFPRLGLGPLPLCSGLCLGLGLGPRPQLGLGPGLASTSQEAPESC